jgi:hypothetical protein
MAATKPIRLCLGNRPNESTNVVNRAAMVGPGARGARLGATGGAGLAAGSAATGEPQRPQNLSSGTPRAPQRPQVTRRAPQLAHWVAPACRDRPQEGQASEVVVKRVE